ncbi:MAG: vanadium-dependent haloperoxidase [Hymenobacter sp.]|nr:vanadium-dependent haloperoxidase [Hymenobacter sp.]
MSTTRQPPCPGRFALFFRLLLLGSLLAGPACTDDDDSAADPSPATASYPADVALAWMKLHLRLVQTTPVAPFNVFGRSYGYAGIVGYEAVVPGMPGYKSLAGQLNGLTGLPTADKSLVYNWPLSANAALAAIHRNLFINTSLVNKTVIDSLENATSATYGASLSPEVRTRSVEFGPRVAAAVAAWMATDGYDYTASFAPPTGPGMWVPTPPAYGAATFPHWGKNRPLVAGSDASADPGPPPTYSTVPGSSFYGMAQEVYTLSQNLTPEQRTIALFWNDPANGQSFTPPGHWLSIMHQILTKEKAPLDKALLAYARLGICLNEAAICCFKTKYTYTLLRPITYIRTTLGQPAWNSVLISPPFPEYSSAHAVTSGAAAEALAGLFGANYAFTDQNHARFGLGTRSFTSFEQAAVEAGISRFYGGIHYRASCEKGVVQGKKIAQNINAQLAFR